MIQGLGGVVGDGLLEDKVGGVVGKLLSSKGLGDEGKESEPGNVPRGRKRTGEWVKCDCGCGRKIWRTPSQMLRGMRNFFSIGCRNKVYAKGGKKSGPKWEMKEVFDKGGNRMLYMPGHRRARSNGYVMEKVIKAEKVLGRGLGRGERVVERGDGLFVVCGGEERKLA